MTITKTTVPYQLAFFCVTTDTDNDCCTSNFPKKGSWCPLCTIWTQTLFESAFLADFYPFFAHFLPLRDQCKSAGKLELCVGGRDLFLLPIKSQERPEIAHFSPSYPLLVQSLMVHKYPQCCTLYNWGGSKMCQKIKRFWQASYWTEILHARNNDTKQADSL